VGLIDSILPSLHFFQCLFLSPEVEALVKSSADGIFGERRYNEHTIRDDTNTLLQTVISGLMDLQKPFKYVGKPLQKLSGRL